MEADSGHSSTDTDVEIEIVTSFGKTCQWMMRSKWYKYSRAHDLCWSITRFSIWTTADDSIGSQNTVGPITRYNPDY